MDYDALSKDELMGKLRNLEGELAKSRAKLEDLIHSNPAVIYACKAEGDFGATFISENIRQQFGYEPQDFTEDSGFWLEHVHPDDKDRVLTELDAIFEAGHVEYEYRFQHKNGQYHWVRDESRLNRDSGGQPREIAGYWIDITDKKNAQAELERRVLSQSQAILELSTPILEIWDEVLVAPLIGTIDTARAQQILENLLDAIVKAQASVVIVDITGVPVIDTKVANHLLEAIGAARTIGAEVIVTGVSPHNAQTLTKLRVDLSNITTKSSLLRGLKVALELTGNRVVRDV